VGRLPRRRCASQPRREPSETASSPHSPTTPQLPTRHLGVKRPPGAQPPRMACNPPRRTSAPPRGHFTTEAQRTQRRHGERSSRRFQVLGFRLWVRAVRRRGCRGAALPCPRGATARVQRRGRRGERENASATGRPWPTRLPPLQAAARSGKKRAFSCMKEAAWRRRPGGRPGQGVPVFICVHSGLWALARFCAPWVSDAGEKEKNVLPRRRKASHVRGGDNEWSWQAAEAFFSFSPGN